MEDFEGVLGEGTTIYIYPVDLAGEGQASHIVRFQRQFMSWPPVEDDVG